jgi:hypothetical protein
VLGCDIKSFFDKITNEHLKNCMFGNINLCKQCKMHGQGCSPSLYKQSGESAPRNCEEMVAVFDPSFIGETGYQSLFTRVLSLCIYENSAPQGFPTSPAIANIVMRGFDKYFSTFCAEAGLSYTRYADDITVSSPKHTPEELADSCLKPIMHKLFGFGFNLNPSKTRVISNGNRQVVTGIIVNTKTSLGVKRTRRIRARVHQFMTGKLVLNRQELMELKGTCAYLAMVNPEQSKYLRMISSAARFKRLA